jgi:hypothetical protein
VGDGFDPEGVGHESLTVKPCGLFLWVECVQPIFYFETCAFVEGH